MKRRALLARTGTLAAVALAGCLSDPPGGGDTPDGGGADEDTPTDTLAPTDTPTPEDPTATDDPATPSEVTEASFEVQSVSSGRGENSATVSFDERVAVDGIIGGNNGCYTAELAAIDLTEGALTVTVEAYEDRGEDEACTDALVDIDYEASFAFEGALPERVVVEHDSMGETRTVADETR